MSKERLHWIDVSKGILILLLLLHHFSVAKRVLEIDGEYFTFITCWQKVYTAFFMQAFLIMSGYCSNFNKSSQQFWGGVIKQLVIPFIFFQFVICCISSIEKSNFTINGIFNIWISFGGTTLWFLNALIVSKIIIYYMRRNVQSVSIIFIFTLFLLLIAHTLDYFDWGTNFLCIRQSLGSVFFVYFGCMLREKDGLFSKCSQLGYIYPYVLLMLLLFKLPIPASTANMASLILVPLFVPLSISGSMAFFTLCKKINSSAFLEYFGRNSLIVYGVHFELLCTSIILTLRIIHVNNIFMGIIASVIIYASLVLACTVLIELFKRVPMKWFVGRF